MMSPAVEVRGSPVPYLSGEEAIGTFRMPPGFRAELVAQEPAVQHPVAMAFDADGRMYVVEMRSYMPDISGQGEDTPDGRVILLQDTTGDGFADKASVFIEGLVLPRAVAVWRDGILVATPPVVLFCRDTTGDGRADEQTVVIEGYGGPGNPEHLPNGLLYGLDNWLHSAAHNKRYREVHGRWVEDVVARYGQWGVTQDDWGRLFHDTNSSYLRGNVVPPHYVTRNPHYSAAGVNIVVDSDQHVWPAHVTAINRGYRPGVLRQDGRLSKFTAACAPWIYRGDMFPPEYYGNVFVCEPTANLIRRSILWEKGVVVVGRNAYEEDEFLTSTYERFRPVNLYTGPDGSIYVIDMHHGLIQHRQFVTKYLEHHYAERNLGEYLRTGRIYRIVSDNRAPGPRPALSQANIAQLVEALSHPNAWWRETAQRLLVERNAVASVRPLRQLARSGEPLPRLHALWTLEGMRRLDTATAVAALSDEHPKLRAQAIRICELFLPTPWRDEVLPAILTLADDQDPDVTLQFALTISEIDTPESRDALAKVLWRAGGNAYIRDAAVSGLRGRELDFLEELLARPEFHEQSRNIPGVLSALAQCVMAQRSEQRIARLLELIAYQPPELGWRRAAMLEGATANTKARPLMFHSEPVALAVLASNTSGRDQERALALKELIVWPGKEGYTPPPPPVPLSAAQQELFERGRVVYATTCLQCHMSDGRGQDGLAPPLANSEWVVGSEQRLARIVLHGMRGPVMVDGKQWNMDMPGLMTLSDEEVAAVLTYVRREWEHTAPPVEVKTVRQIRAVTKGRFEAWTERELLAIP